MHLTAGDREQAREGEAGDSTRKYGRQDSSGVKESLMVQWSERTSVRNGERER